MRKGLPKQRPVPRRLSAKARAKLDASGTARLDGWTNLSTGFGVAGRDKRLGSEMSVCVLSQEQNEHIWRGDAIAARMVETLPREMMREGFCTTTPEDVEAGEDVDERARDLGVAEHIELGLRYGKALGGGAILLGVDDGQALDKPLNEKTIRAFTWVNTLTPRELQPVKWYSDPTGPRYGEISQYRIIPFDPPPDQMVSLMPIVHESRLVRFDGIVTTRGARIRNENQPGWDDSIFVRSLQTITDFQHAHAGLAALLQDFSVPVLAMKGLAKLLATAKPGDTTLMQRANALELCRSVMRVAIVDADGESYKRETTTVTGLGDLMEQIALRLAAEANMPVSLLMGQAPAGLNATGDSDIRWFYDQIKAAQIRQVKPGLRKILRLIMLDRSGPLRGQEAANWDIKFNPLWQLTDVEKAAVRLSAAQADSANIASGIVTPEEVAQSRFGGDDFSLETQLDQEARDAFAAQPDPAQDPLADPAQPTDSNADPLPAPAPAPAMDPLGNPIPGAPMPKATAGAAAKLQDTALNGAQVTSALEIVKSVARDELPRESGVSMLETFFNMSPEDADRVMGPVGKGFKSAEVDRLAKEHDLKVAQATAPKIVAPPGVPK